MHLYVYLFVLCRIAYRKSGERGGGFTYMDLCVLADSALAESLCQMLLEMCKVMLTSFLHILSFL